MTACTLAVSWSTTRYAHDSQSIILLSSLCAERSLTLSACIPYVNVAAAIPS